MLSPSGAKAPTVWIIKKPSIPAAGMDGVLPKKSEKKEVFWLSGT
jgi:hypothetical protein